MMNEVALVTPPTVCGLAEIELAHRQMQRHRACRIDRCAWKWVAYCTLVHYGRVEPPELSPRERAYLRGIAFPADDTDHRPSPAGTPKAVTFQQVLDGLSALAHDMRHPSDEASER
ncbi:hypothetical protein OHA40_05910 [Nocardia sp. NBC_00508]|uniref:hypothetical protein n=1 Tax=Nocardia sp. NBC_00508 TaxID=2975992 RepID=UPI002E805061|nr:hypothetical protein [Nocardia sp. NBC_00508]WUD67664.1 hypothetical protein OHA40_05910 [Nocardia sp. NBC_00508]